MEKIIKLYIEDSFKGTRLDKYLVQDEILLENVETISRAYIQKLIKEKRITVNNKDIKASYSLVGGEEIIIQVPIIFEPGDIDAGESFAAFDPYYVYFDNQFIIIE